MELTVRQFLFLNRPEPGVVALVCTRKDTFYPDFTCGAHAIGHYCVELQYELSLLQNYNITLFVYKIGLS